MNLKATHLCLRIEMEDEGHSKPQNSSKIECVISKWMGNAACKSGRNHFGMSPVGAGIIYLCCLMAKRLAGWQRDHLFESPKVAEIKFKNVAIHFM